MYEDRMLGKIVGLRYRLRHINLLTPNTIAIVALLLGIIIVILGYPIQHPDGFNLKSLVADFYANVATTLIGIAVAVLFIDALNKRRDTESEQRRLVREMGNPDNGIALRAVKEIVSHGYHLDGLLRSQDFTSANLRGAALLSADLRRAIFHHVDLTGAQLYGTDLRGADFWHTRLNGARFHGANVEGARFRWSDLRNARVTREQLETASCLRGAILPDGSLYDGRFALKGDVSEAQMAGVNTNDHEAMAKWYAMSYEEAMDLGDLRKNQPEFTDWEHSR